MPGAELAFGRAGGVEHRRALELGQAVDREPPILGARREQHRSRGDLPVLLEPDEMPTVSRFERERAVGRGGSCVELARLGDGAAGELRSADPRGEAEIVLDSAGRPGLAAERRALDHQRVKPFGGAVDRSREASRTGADDQQIDFLARCELEPDPDRSQQLAGRRPVQLCTARQPHELQRATVDRDGILPGTRDPVRARELENAHRRLRTARADDLQADTLDALQRLASGDERREQEVAQRPVFIEEPAQLGAFDGDVLEWLGYESVDEDRLPRQEVQLPKEPGRAVPDELVPGCVDDRDLPLADRDERISPIANLVEQLTGRRGALLADLGDSR